MPIKYLDALFISHVLASILPAGASPRRAAFSERLKRKGFDAEKGTGGVMWWKGVGLQ